MRKTQQTSRESFATVKDISCINRKKIYAYLFKVKNPVTDLMISDKLGLSINIVTARRNELMNSGLVINDGRLENKTGHSAIAWKIK
jgi:hypothetical protein